MREGRSPVSSDDPERLSEALLTRVIYSWSSGDTMSDLMTSLTLALITHGEANSQHERFAILPTTILPGAYPKCTCFCQSVHFPFSPFERPFSADSAARALFAFHFGHVKSLLSVIT